MNSFVDTLLCRKHDDESSGDELVDKDAKNLSHVGEAVHEALGRHHNRHHKSQWNVTSGKIIGSVDNTPRNVWDTAKDPGSENDDWFPEKMAEIIGRTEAWCDIMSLGPPDGKFLTAFQTAFHKLAERSKTGEKPIVVRMLFGNIAGMPVNCNSVIKALTKDLPKDAKLQLWVGAWRKGFSWNHAKLIAVDGVFLHTGGHNLWDAHYLSSNPVHDLSFELEGAIARDGHRFANQQWEFIKSKQSTCMGCVVDSMPDYLPIVLKTRVTVSEWPKGAVPTFPPQFSRTYVTSTLHQPQLADKSSNVPLISIGRQGSMVSKSRPSDDAILAMINSSQKIIRLVLQDLGPVCLPGTKKGLPGLVWPKNYLAAIGKAIYERGVDIEMVLSNPNSIPGGLKGTEANYGNGWDCVDVAAEIIKRIQKQHSDIDDARLRAMIADNLRICFIRHDKSSAYEDGKTIGLHSKHFIVDDKCCYIGSQNLYMCDLAEWGIVVDSEEEVKKIMNDYFVPMWKNSYTGEDVDVEKVMDGLDVDRNGEQTMFSGLQSADAVMPHGTGAEYYDIEKDDNEETEETGPSAAAKAAEKVDSATPGSDESTNARDSTIARDSPTQVSNSSTAGTSTGSESPAVRGSPLARDDKNVDQDSASEERVTEVTPPLRTAPSESEVTSTSIWDDIAAMVPFAAPVLPVTSKETATTEETPTKDETALVLYEPKEIAAPEEGAAPEEAPAPKEAPPLEEAPAPAEAAAPETAPATEDLVVSKESPAPEEAVTPKKEQAPPLQKQEGPQLMIAETEHNENEPKKSAMPFDCCGMFLASE